MKYFPAERINENFSSLHIWSFCIKWLLTFSLQIRTEFVSSVLVMITVVHPASRKEYVQLFHCYEIIFSFSVFSHQPIILLCFFNKMVVKVSRNLLIWTNVNLYSLSFTTNTLLTKCNASPYCPIFSHQFVIFQKFVESFSFSVLSCSYKVSVLLELANAGFLKHTCGQVLRNKGQ
jgi:hypothetical protein